MASAQGDGSRKRQAAGGAQPTLWPVSVHNRAGQAIVGAVCAHLFVAGFLALMQPMDLPLGPVAKHSIWAKAVPPDESAHVAYFEELLATCRLPVLKAGVGNYEAHQPPLYYLLATPIYAVFLSFGKPVAICAVRLLNVLLGAASVLALARLSILAFPGNGWFVVFATLFGACWPARLLACAGAGNDPLVELACLIALVLLAKLVTGPLEPRAALGAGLAIGVAMLSKSSALPLVPVGLLAVYLSWKRGCLADGGADWRRLGIGTGALLGGFLLLWGPWAVRNVVLYGDPFAAEVFRRIFGEDRATPEYFLSRGFSGTQYFALVLYQTALSFWGVLGQANVFLPSVLYTLGFVFWGATAIVGLSGLIWRGDRPSESARPIWTLLALHGALMLAFFLRFNAEFYQAQARYFMPATAVIAFYMARPWARRDWPAWLRDLGMRLWILAIIPVTGYILYIGITGSLTRLFEELHRRAVK